jgi:hypothetical protein
MKFVFRNVSDETLIAPAIITIFDESEKKITTTNLINKLRNQFDLPENEKKLLTGRKDDVFSQKVRNIKSHKTLEKMNLIYEANNYIWLTEHGKNLGNYLKNNLKNLDEIKEKNIDDLKHYKNLIFKSTYNLKFNPFYLNKISDFDLSLRCTNILKKLKIIYIGDLVQLNEKNILKEKNSGIKTLNEIKYFLKDHDINFSSIIEDWNEENIKKYRDLFFLKKKKNFRLNLDQIFREKITQKEKISDMSFKRYSEVINRRLALDGTFLSLQEIGEKYEVTRERIRQISKNFFDKIKKYDEVQYAFNRLLKYIKSNTPITEKVLKNKLIENNFFDTEKSLPCLRNIINNLGKFDFDVINLPYHGNISDNFDNDTFLVKDKSEQKTLLKILSVSRKYTQKYSYCNFPKLIFDIYKTNNLKKYEVIKTCLQQHDLFFWFDEDNYTVLDTKENRNKIINTLKKLLFINKKITYEVFSEALLNNYRLQYSPPKALLKQICILNKFKCDDDYIYSDGVSVDLGNLDLAIIKMFQENGDFLHMYQCLEWWGINHLNTGSLGPHLYSHSIVKKLDDNVFCLYGTKEDLEKIEYAKNYLKRNNIEKNFEVECLWGSNQEIIIKFKVNKFVRLKNSIFVPTQFQDYIMGDFLLNADLNQENREVFKIYKGIIYNINKLVKNLNDNETAKIILSFNPNIIKVEKA